MVFINSKNRFVVCGKNPMDFLITKMAWEIAAAEDLEILSILEHEANKEE